MSDSSSFLQVIATKPPWQGRVPQMITESCLAVDLQDSEAKEILNEIVFEMFRTLYHTFAVGLAAPQVGIRWRLAVIDTAYLTPPAGNLTHPPQECRRLILVNPEIVPADDSPAERSVGTETCLSVPGYVGQVPRWNKIRVRNTRLSGEVEEFIATGFLARVIQHEADHLSGRLFYEHLTTPEALQGTESGRFGARVRATMKELGLPESG